MGSDFLAVLSPSGTLLTDEFFAASVLSVMLASGRSLERWAEGRANSELESLVSRAPRAALLISGTIEIGPIPVENVKIGDLNLIRSAEVVPVEGTLLPSAIHVESALSGEPMPVSHREGEQIASGVIHAGQTLYLVASAFAATSTYTGIIRMVEQARAGTSSGVRLANQWAKRFVPVALLVAVFAGILKGDPRRSIAVLVAATPCPLFLAVPVAIVAGMSNAAKAGVII